MKLKSKDYIKGFEHGVRWALIMSKVSLYKFAETIGQGELVEIELDNIQVDSKEAVKNMKKGEKGGGK